MYKYDVQMMVRERWKQLVAICFGLLPWKTYGLEFLLVSDQNTHTKGSTHVSDTVSPLKTLPQSVNRLFHSLPTDSLVDIFPSRRHL